MSNLSHLNPNNFFEAFVLRLMAVLQEFKGAVDDGSVPEVNIREVRPFLDLEHFKVEVIEKRNSAAAGLCSWVLNIVQYYDIVRTVEPKRRALQEANDQLAKANLELGEVRWFKGIVAAACSMSVGRSNRRIGPTHSRK